MDNNIKRLKNVYRAMKNRCINTNRHNYHRYGGRGINVCEEWSDDINMFVKWSLDNGYKQGLQLDRIDNNKGYSPKNCRWVTPKENANNREVNGMTRGSSKAVSSRSAAAESATRQGTRPKPYSSTERSPTSSRPTATSLPEPCACCAGASQRSA